LDEIIPAKTLPTLFKTLFNSKNSRSS